MIKNEEESILKKGRSKSKKKNRTARGLGRKEKN
jgi:hypothetical protein